jgi:hypothetical protein
MDYKSLWARFRLRFKALWQLVGFYRGEVAEMQKQARPSGRP